MIDREAYARARAGESIIIDQADGLVLALHRCKAKVDWNAWLNGDVCFLKSGYTVQNMHHGAILRWRGKGKS